MQLNRQWLASLSVHFPRKEPRGAGRDKERGGGERESDPGRATVDRALREGSSNWASDTSSKHFSHVTFHHTADYPTPLFPHSPASSLPPLHFPFFSTCYKLQINHVLLLFNPTGFWCGSRNRNQLLQIPYQRFWEVLCYSGPKLVLSIWRGSNSTL